jgi:hypothetical protein
MTQKGTHGSKAMHKTTHGHKKLRELCDMSPTSVPTPALPRRPGFGTGIPADKAESRASNNWVFPPKNLSAKAYDDSVHFQRRSHVDDNM